jgi:alpha-L-fucosidase
MKHKFWFIGFITLLGAGSMLMAQEAARDYVPVTDPLVQQKLEQWQGLKFGLMMHWGPYSQWGVVESWSICSEDWITRPLDDYEEYKRQYRNLKKTFNPTQFDPARWARAAKAAGMKYLIFTTKHHDGFCMFDSKLTDFKITSPECPFHSHPNADIARALFDAFRQEGFMIGVYFSKPDWNSEYYWWNYYATPDRHVNYDPAKFPERWQKFKDFTYGQIEELMTRYGRIDILWLDGAWVRPIANMPKEFEDWAKKKNYHQDIDMARIAAMARNHQPGIIIVDRWVSGEFENYLTPEQKIPERPLNVPWESCITMAEGWSYNKDHHYKSAHQLIHTLVEIVAKGGNFLLNIGPSPEGDWADAAYDRLKGIGAWMKINGEAIDETHPLAPYREGKVCLTEKRDGTVYAIYLADEDEKNPPSKIWLSTMQPAAGAKLSLLGVHQELAWEKVGKGFLVHIPEAIQKNPPCQEAWVIKIDKKNGFD